MATAELQSVLSVNNKPFIAGMNEAVAKGKSSGSAISGAFKGMGGALAGAFTIGAVISFGKSIVDLGGELADSAERLSLNVETLQGLQFAFGQSGTSGEQFEKSMVKLNQSLADAQDANPKMLASFKELGITFGDLIGATPDEVLLKIADGMRNAEDPARALAAVMDILGKSGAKMIPGLKGGSDALKNLSDQALKLTQHETENIDSIGDAFSQMWQAARTGSAKFVSYAIDDTKKLVDFIKESLAPEDLPNPTGADILNNPTVTDADRTAMTRGPKVPSLEESFPVTGGGEMSWEEVNAMNEQSRKNQELDESMAREKQDMEEAAAATRSKNLAEAAAIVRKELVAEMDGQGKLNELTRERADIMAQIAATGDASGALQVDLAKKSVEIAKQTKENEKEKAKSEMQAAAESSSAVSSGGIRTGGLRNVSLNANVHSLVRRGDAARARAEKAKDGKVEGMSATAYNTAQIAKAFGLTGKDAQ